MWSLAKCFTPKYLKFVVDCPVFQYFLYPVAKTLFILLVSSTALKDVLIHPWSSGVCIRFLPQANLFLNELIGHSISGVLLTFVPRPDVSELTTLSSHHQVFFSVLSRLYFWIVGLVGILNDGVPCQYVLPCSSSSLWAAGSVDFLADPICLRLLDTEFVQVLDGLSFQCSLAFPYNCRSALEQCALPRNKGNNLKWS